MIKCLVVDSLFMFMAWLLIADFLTEERPNFFYLILNIYPRFCQMYDIFPHHILSVQYMSNNVDRLIFLFLTWKSL
jgi:hypothetical protein